MSELTHEELEFLLALLEHVQISGNAEQVRAVLRLRDGAMGKLGRSAGKGDEDERRMTDDEGPFVPQGRLGTEG